MNQSQIHVYDFLKLVVRKSCSHYIFHILLDFSLRMTSSLPSVFFFLLQQIYALRITNPRATCSFEPHVVRVVRKLPKIVSNANQMQSLIRKHRYQSSKFESYHELKSHVEKMVPCTKWFGRFSYAPLLSEYRVFC